MIFLSSSIFQRLPFLLGLLPQQAQGSQQNSDFFGNDKSKSVPTILTFVESDSPGLLSVLRNLTSSKQDPYCCSSPPQCVFETTTY